MKDVTVTVTDEVFDIDWESVRYTLYITEGKRWITISREDYDLHLDLDNAIKLSNAILAAISSLYASEGLMKNVVEAFK